MAKIFIENLILEGIHGATSKEKINPQKFRIDVELEIDFAAVEKSKDMADVVDYRKVKKIVKDIIAGPHIELVETIALEMADQILVLDQRIQSTQVTLKKIEIWDNGVPGVVIKKENR